MNNRVPSVPLITCDPYFSLWSPADCLYDADTVHWTGRVKRADGIATIDGKDYRFMGAGQELSLKQTSLEITATSSRYVFEGAGVKIDLEFLTPLLLDDLDLLSRPVSYIGAKVSCTDGKSHNTTLSFYFWDSHCKDTLDPEPFVPGVHKLKGCEAAWMGKRHQAPLSHSGDDITIDWGYLYVAAEKGKGSVLAQNEAKYSRERLSVTLNFTENGDEAFFAAAYDDIASINYFGELRRGYWARNGKTILEAIEEAVRDYASIKKRCADFDCELNEKALSSGGEDYARILNLSYRQTIAAHKLITDEKGDVLFISKECFSNGCAATVDVTYPSAPLYLLYNPELVKGMLRPIFRFAKLPVWTYDFAPHDAGRYPHVTGQVYGLSGPRMQNSETYPPYYTYPENANIYDLKYQMPVEECGNMLILMAALAKAEGNADFSKPYMDLAEKWAAYLVEFGANPGEQLCTDDFAGHLASNCNLSAKAIMGLVSYAMLLDMQGAADKAETYRTKARSFAEEWKKNAGRGDHTALVFDRDEGWSLKYNLVWDILFESNLFDKAFYKSEIAWYLKMNKPYGVPLDSRRDYTKSDWILWTASFTNDKDEREKLIAPIAAFLRDTNDRVPFSDWYDTVNARHYHFQNRTVQGGLFMPLLAEEWNK